MVPSVGEKYEKDFSITKWREEAFRSRNTTHHICTFFLFTISVMQNISIILISISRLRNVYQIVFSYFKRVYFNRVYSVMYCMYTTRTRQRTVSILCRFLHLYFHPPQVVEKFSGPERTLIALPHFKRTRIERNPPKQIAACTPKLMRVPADSAHLT